MDFRKFTFVRHLMPCWTFVAGQALFICFVPFDLLCLFAYVAPMFLSGNVHLLLPQRGPILLLLLAHERTDIHTLAQLEPCVPQEHVHGVEVEVRVGYNKAVEVVGKTSHVQRRLSRANGDIAALLGSIVVLLLIDALEDFLYALEELNDLVESLEVTSEIRNLNLGQLQEVKSCEGELGKKDRLHAEGQHVAKVGVENLLVRGKTAL